jgi:hypothetical protein
MFQNSPVEMQELKNSPYGISERMTASIFSYGSSEDKL